MSHGMCVCVCVGSACEKCIPLNKEYFYILPSMHYGKRVPEVCKKYFESTGLCKRIIYGIVGILNVLCVAKT